MWSWTSICIPVSASGPAPITSAAAAVERRPSSSVTGVVFKERRTGVALVEGGGAESTVRVFGGRLAVNEVGKERWGRGWGLGVGGWGGYLDAIVKRGGGIFWSGWW